MEINLDNLPVSQQPEWPDSQQLATVVTELRGRLPLTSPRDTDKLLAELGNVARGHAFLLQGGSCAESFTDEPSAVQNLLNVMLPMTVTLMLAGMPVTKVGRLAGQFAKPRSSDYETRDSQTLPSYRGDIINGPEFTAEARRPDPSRMLRAYNHSARTLATLREMTRLGGFADLERMHEWNVKFAADSSQSERYQVITGEISRIIRFMKSSGVDDHELDEFHKSRVYTSHEALLMDYELALTRPDENGDLYDTSGHMVWIGERTRDINEAHVEFCSKIMNPVAVKLGPSATEDEVLALCERLNPDNIPGRLSLITRMGQASIGNALPSLFQAVRKSGTSVLWVCDPMHGNTTTVPSGLKTRHFDDITSELRQFVAIAKDEGAWPGGVHLELTGEDVTECLGGSEPYAVEDLSGNYATTCDPRINPTQGLEVAFLLTEQLTSNIA